MTVVRVYTINSVNQILLHGKSSCRLGLKLLLRRKVQAGLSRGIVMHCLQGSLRVEYSVDGQ
jgi:hypothetical protein